MRSFATFRSLTAPQERDLAGFFSQMAAQLADSAEQADAQFRILDGDELHSEIDYRFRISAKELAPPSDVRMATP